MAVDTAASRTVSISGERFAALWRETSMSQETFAAAIGMKRSGVFRLLRPGKHGMFTDNFRRLAEVLKTSPDELRSRIGSDAIELSALNMAERSEEFSSGVIGQAQPIREVTQFNGISAGARAERTDLQRGKVKVPRDFGDFFVRVDGESMTPEYPNDSVAIFEMVDGQTFVFGKEYLIWFTNGECYFSSVYESDDDRDVIVLRKLHADRERFPDRQIHRREIDRIARCIGVLIHRR
jgi:phage repressor protein C with HTH and peptisase S24 domain